MKKILLLLALSVPLLFAKEPTRGVPYLRTQVVGMSKGQKTVRIMVWAKDIPLTLRAFKSPTDTRPLVQNLEEGKTADIQFTATNSYIIQVEHEGKVIAKHTPTNKGGGL